MFLVKQFNQVSAYSYTTVHVEELPTLEEALSYVKHVIDLDLKVESNCCDEMQILDSNNKCIKSWAWCPDDIDAPCVWNEV
tara:strand:- start:6289 stop:6531 length:243 start_codon:yes stop_codon:yes gene_type:complete